MFFSDFVNGLESLKQLTTENVVEASVKCLKIINPDIKMSHILPPGNLIYNIHTLFFMKLEEWSTA